MYSRDDLASAFQDLYSCNFKNYKTLCPFHQEKRGSLSLKDSEKPTYRCFSCGERGDIWDLHQKALGVSFLEAIEIVKNKFGINHPKNYSNNNNYKLRNNMKNLHIEKAIDHARMNNLIYITSYEYSNTNYKHRFLSKNNIKTFIHTYFDSEKNKVFTSKDLLNDRDKKLIVKIYNKAKIEYAISNNLDFYICEGEKDSDNLSRLGFYACHIENTKEEELNKMLKNNLDFSGNIFHIHDVDPNRFGKNIACKRASSINYNQQYLIEPKEKDISDQIDRYGINKTKDYILFKSKEDKTIAFTDEEQAYEYTINKRNEKVYIPNEYNIEKFIDINIKGALCVDCITKKSVILSDYGDIDIYNERENSPPYDCARAIIRKFGKSLTMTQVENSIDKIWNKREVNIFELMLKRYETDDSFEFNRFINDFYNSLDKNFTSKEVFEELFTFFFTRTVRRAIDYKKRPDQCLKMIFTIIGFQSCGKSRFVEKIFHNMEMYDFVRAGATLGSLSRDDIMIVTSAPIVELAETTSLLRSAKYSEDLKRFISQSSDSYRAPYAKASTSHPRISSYIYTTNQEVILRDKTGNTRFYTIKAIKEIPNPTDYNMKNVWGYIYNLAKNVSENELDDYYNIPITLKDYIYNNNDKLFDISHHFDELENLEKEENEYMVYSKTDVEQILQINDRKSKLDFHASMESKGYKYKAYKVNGNRVVRGYLLNKLKLYPSYGHPKTI